jgi:hypothetical protein
MLAWKVEPCALSVPVAHGGAEPPDAAALATLEDEPAAGVLAAGALAAEVGVDEALVLLLFVPHAAAANNPPAVSKVAAMREVLTG